MITMYIIVYNYIRIPGAELMVSFASHYQQVVCVWFVPQAIGPVKCRLSDKPLSFSVPMLLTKADAQFHSCGERPSLVSSGLLKPSRLELLRNLVSLQFPRTRIQFYRLDSLSLLRPGQKQRHFWSIVVNYRFLNNLFQFLLWQNRNWVFNSLWNYRVFKKLWYQRLAL